MLANLKRLSLRQTYFLQKTFHSSSIMQGKVALVLSGCGVYDGSEIHEASACMVHLSREGADVSVFAPDIPQLHVINHCKGEPQEGAPRNVLEESARIARGNISPLSSLKTDEFSAIVVPGGFGAAKNLCNFAVNGADCNVNEDLSRALKEFHAQKKPIGLCCIAPVIAAKVIKGSEVTVGHSKDEDGKWPYAGTAEAIATMGAMHVEKDVTDVHVDKKNLVVTTPAYMCNTELHNVFDGIGKMIQTVVNLATK